MNSKQKEVLLVGTLLVLLMILFPPWEYFDIDSSSRSSAGYHFILTPPALKSPQEMFGVPKMRVTNTVRVRVDDVKLIIQLLVTIPIILGLVPLLSNRRTFIKMAIGFLLIGFALFILGFTLWLEISSRQKWSNQGRNLTTHSTGARISLPFIVSLSVMALNARPVNSGVRWLRFRTKMGNMEHWLKLYRSRNQAVKIRAARSLLRKGSEIPLSVLLSIFDNLSDEGLGAAAEKALKKRRDPELVHEMITRLNAPKDFIREVACVVLGGVGDRRATSHLLGMLNDPHMMVRRAAALALASLKDPTSIGELKRQRVLRRSDDINVRFAIECALKELGEEYVNVLSDAI